MENQIKDYLFQKLKDSLSVIEQTAKDNPYDFVVLITKYNLEMGKVTAFSDILLREFKGTFTDEETNFLKNFLSQIVEAKEQYCNLLERSHIKIKVENVRFDF